MILDVCALKNPECPIMINCQIYDKLDERDIDGTSMTEFTYTFDDLRPYHQYQVRVVARNIAGSSAEATAVVITRPAFGQDQKIGVEVEPGNDYVVIRLTESFCPYLGPIKLRATVFQVYQLESQRSVNDGELEFDISEGSTGGTFVMDGLESEKNYMLCMNASLTNQEPRCQENCQIVQECKEFTTSCKAVLPALGVPISEPWTYGSNFNPFNQVGQNT
jgi:hypothetical protein